MLTRAIFIVLLSFSALLLTTGGLYAKPATAIADNTVNH